MQKIGILVDSTITFDEQYIKDNNIYIVPLYLNFDNASFQEKGDINKLTEEIVSRIRTNKEIPKTSQPSAQDFLNKYEEMIEDGCEKIFAFHLSSKLSGTMQGSKIAADMIMEKNPKIEINVFDTLATSYIASYMIIDVIDQIKHGLQITKKEVQNIIDYYIDNTKAIFCVDNLDFLSYGGRISSKMAAVGNLFGIKPILALQNGEIVEFDKVRSQKKAYKRLLDEFYKEVDNLGAKEIQFSVIHVLNEKDAYKIAQMMEKKSGKKADTITYLSTVISNHVGPGTIAIVYCPKRI